MNLFDDIKMQYRMGGFEQKLIYWNIAAYLITLVFFYQFRFGVFSFPSWISLSSNLSDVLYKPWTLLTYAFVHSGFVHLFFNMLILNFSGRLFLTFFTQRQLLGAYIFGAVFSGIVYVLVYSFFGLQNNTIVGASGAIMALLVATATYAPFMNIRLLLIGNVKLWHVTGVIILLDLLQILTENTGGHIAHLAGSFFGFLFVKLLQNGIDISKMIPDFNRKSAKKQKHPFKKIHVNQNVSSTKSTYPTSVQPKSKTEQQIDEILDKISSSGYDSLTKEEKEFLFKAGK